MDLYHAYGHLPPGDCWQHVLVYEHVQYNTVPTSAPPGAQTLHTYRPGQRTNNATPIITLPQDLYCLTPPPACNATNLNRCFSTPPLPKVA